MKSPCSCFLHIYAFLAALEYMHFLPDDEEDILRFHTQPQFVNVVFRSPNTNMIYNLDFNGKQLSRCKGHKSNGSGYINEVMM